MTQRFVSGTPLTGPGETPIAKPEPPLKEVLVELWENTEKLVRQEAALASAELDQKARRLKAELKTEAIALGVGGAVLHAGMLAMVAALILLLSLAVPPWAAALIVGAVACIAGFVMVKREPKIDSHDLVPTHTIASVKKDVQTFREATK